MNADAIRKLPATDQFRVAMRDAGLTYDGPIIDDGKRHRFRAVGDHAKNSWYILHAGPPAAGAFGCWKRSINETWCDRGGKQLTPTEREALKRKITEAAQTRQHEEKLRSRKAQKLATWILSKAGLVNQQHPYLVRKGVKPHGELRQRGDDLVLPLRDVDGVLHSLQFIASDKRFDGERDKDFLWGGRTLGCFYTVADAGTGTLVVCEGVATGLSIFEATGHSTVCAMHCGNLLPVARALHAKFPHREIIIAADNDAFTTDKDGQPKDHGVEKGREAALAIGARIAISQFKDTTSKPTDFNDLHQSVGLAEVRRQIEAAQPVKETDEESYARLAAMPPAQYDRCRKNEAKRLGIRPQTLDDEVSKCRVATSGPDERGTTPSSDLVKPEPEPWPDEVDGSQLLESLAATLNRFVVFGHHAADALALFILETYAAVCFDAAPYVHLTSPEKRCGKSLVIRLLALLCARALPAGPCTESAIFRAIAATTPTLLIDEVDTFFADRHELRGMLNVGNIRDDAAVMRTEEVVRNGAREFVVRRYSVFCPKVFGGIGKLADTLADRSIVVLMRRKRVDEKRERFRRRNFNAEPLRRQCRRWADDNADALAAAEPRLPEQLNDRAADLWEPLLAIADRVGGPWPERARAAAVALSGESDDGNPTSLGGLLLADIRHIFDEDSADRIGSAQLCEKLVELEERPWGEIHHNKAITQNRLSRMLAPYGVTSRKIRQPDGTRQGYLREDFEDAWQRYVPVLVPPTSNWNNGTRPVNNGETRVSEVEQSGDVFHSEKSISPNNDAGCSTVPLLPPPNPPTAQSALVEEEVV